MNDTQLLLFMKPGFFIHFRFLHQFKAAAIVEAQEIRSEVF